MRRTIVAALVLLMVASLFGCASMSKRDLGALIGAGGGAAVGAAVGKAAGNTAAGTIVGAVVGGAAGAIIGNYMDEQAAEMQRDLEGAKVERIGEGIKITFGSGILFDTDKSELKPEAQQNLDELAGILNKYPDTNILLAGHTDAVGSEEYNMALSERRVREVANYLAMQGVSSPRMTVTWYGESQPVASNETPEGRQANRRVEIAVVANEKLKKAAMKQAEQDQQ
jgi:outer membrane protein OmpA-like peptidoglycan-associated protein